MATDSTFQKHFRSITSSLATSAIVVAIYYYGEKQGWAFSTLLAVALAVTLVLSVLEIAIQRARAAKQA